MLKTAKSNFAGPFIEAAVLILMATGTVFVYSAGANVSSAQSLRYFYNFTTLKQVCFFPLAVAVMYTVAQIDYRRFSFTFPAPVKSITPYLLILSIVLLILVLVPSIGIERNFSRRWLGITIGPISITFQPSELAKWALLFFLAAYLDKFSDSIKLYWKRFVPACLVAGAIAALILVEDFGTAAFLALLTFLMLIIGRACWWHFLTPLPAVIPALYFAVAGSVTRVNRLKAFFNPDANISANYQASQSLIAISTSGIWGKGLGRGVCKYGHLPEDTTDFIFAIIAEEFGFVGAGFVILVFIALIAMGIIVSMRCRDSFGRMLAGCIVLAIGIQAAINIGVATVVLPTKGIPLPFVSAGGTSMLLSAAAVGVLLNIAKQTACGEEISI